MTITSEITREQLDIYQASYEGGQSSIFIGENEYFGHDSAEVKEILIGAFTSKEESELMTREEVCKLLKISRRSLYSWHTSGKLHASKIGQRLLFSRDEVMALLKEKQTCNN